MTINRDRLARIFTTMCGIDSPSGEEARMAVFIKELFAREFPEAIINEDSSASTTGSDANNLVIHFPGDLEGDPIFFNCHLDTVEPGRGIQVSLEGSRFSSKGDTILGGDDKAGIAILIEAIRTIKEARTSHLPFDLVFTTSEEIGLRGAKALDLSLLRAKEGYALDSTGVDLLIIGAPAANHFHFTITGAAAHAGLHPERGINAIQLAARCLADLPLGRLDGESTANIGRISGGTATNIIPETALVAGEVRSHSPEKLTKFSHEIRDTVQSIIDGWTPEPGAQLGAEVRPHLDFQLSQEYPAMSIDRNASVLQRVDKAAAILKREIRYERAGGGSDANIFNGKGIPTAIIGIGMDHVHSTEESIDLSDMERTAELVIALLTN
ncbi:M20/M25/M40 family metallo-hydrolase [Thiovibrio frasassiensis]|uniref:M20/M25/M40 family metallo-hydrolase n=1 Tax=Thiovibrio frasassiensis TaxID=2984131 RepID=A0A9X4MG79_9BACT|nr:M20/M25/M40 family metallo-hydrolase [Thiovibrio frasassiensis]MDG4475680.1 M20/M25/M40 family metallo-hydrolase [Thiovibrio frasassiensis]